MNRKDSNYRSGSFIAIMFALALTACAGAPTAGETAAARAELAPTGKLRVALLMGSALFVKKDPASGEVRGGLAVEAGRALAARLGVPFEPVGYATIGKFMEAVKSGDWDVIVVGIDPARAAVLDFTAPFVEVDSTYLVPGNSPILGAIDADQSTVRIAVVAKSGQDLYFARNPLRHATLVRGEGAPATFALLKSGEAHAFAENRQVLMAFAKQLPGSRILTDRFDVLPIAIALPKGRTAGLVYAQDFVQRATGAGEVQEWLQRSGLNGARVAAR
jgi:polar amino acid transport system substrate-binding protein